MNKIETISRQSSSRYYHNVTIISYSPYNVTRDDIFASKKTKIKQNSTAQYTIIILLSRRRNTITIVLQRNNNNMYVRRSRVRCYHCFIKFSYSVTTDDRNGGK